MNNFKMYFLTATSIVFSSLGLLAIPLTLLAVCNLADWLTGIMAASYMGSNVNSKKSLQGIFKKIAMYFLVFVGFAIDILINYVSSNFGVELLLPNIVACIVATWLVLHELLSITENCLALGIEVPFLNPFINLIKGKIEQKGNENNG